MKFAFATCVQLGLSCMEEIYRIGGKLDLAITLLDEASSNKSGRVYIDAFCSDNEIPILKSKNINDRIVIEKLKKQHIDWLFIIGWSQIAYSELLKAPTLGCIGMHPTLLPEGRGRASIPWAIIKGLQKTGVTMFRLDEGVDTGDILAQFVIEITKEETATSLYSKVNEAHTGLIRENWSKIVDGTIVAQKQDNSLATYWEGRKPQDGLISADMTIEQADKLVRAVTKPYPGAFYYIADDKKLTVWSAKFGTEQQLNAFKLSDGYLVPVDYELT